MDWQGGALRRSIVHLGCRIGSFVAEFDSSGLGISGFIVASPSDVDIHQVWAKYSETKASAM